MTARLGLSLWIASWIVALDDRLARPAVSWALATLREGALRALERMQTQPPPAPAPAIEAAPPPSPPKAPPEPEQPPADPTLPLWISKTLSVRCTGIYILGRPPFVIDVMIATPEKTTRKLTLEEWHALAARGVQLLPHDAMIRCAMGRLTSGGEA